MLRTDLPDYRRVSEADLMAALRERDPLALAEAYHRTIPAAHAAARRLLASSGAVEALLRAVYTELWRNPPLDAGLEGWIRARTFNLGLDHLKEGSTAPASPSLATLLPELPKPDVRYLDAAERALAELDERQRRALLMAHDRGVPSDQQDDDGAASALVSALFALAGPEPGGEAADGDCNVSGLGDWVLGLLPPDRADKVAEAVAGSPGCEAAVKGLRRGRRRLEGLPPTPDMGQRILVVVLAGAPAAVAPPAAAPGGAVAAGLRSALDGDVDEAPAAVPDEEDTGDLADTSTGAQEELAAEGMDSGAPGEDATAAYAELAALDEEPVDDSTAGTEEDFSYPDEDRPYPSFGRRVLTWVLSILFLAAGVALGLIIGLRIIG